MKSLWLLLSATAIVTVAIFGNLPGTIQLWRELQDTAHAPAFFVLAIIQLRLIHGARATARYHYPVAFLICLAIGIGIEAVQGLMGGDVSLRDVATDALGTIAGLSAYAYFTSNVAGRLRWMLLSLISIVVAAAPLMWSVAAYLNRAHRFPMLAEFHSVLDLYFIDEHEPPVQIRSTPSEDPTTNEKSLYVPLGQDQWPGITLDEPYPDWSRYQTLAVDLTNPTATALKLNLRVHDRQHTQDFNDRFNDKFEIAAGSRTIVRIPLLKILKAPATRQMDLRQIAGIVIFGNESVAGRAFYLNRIWLE